MKNGLILLAVTLILAGVCGCTQTAPPVQPPAPVTTPLQTTQQLAATTIPVPQTTSSVSDNTIRIKNFAFDPARITMKVGSTARWVNLDSVPHRILFADGAGFSRARSLRNPGAENLTRPAPMIIPAQSTRLMQGTVIVE